MDREFKVSKLASLDYEEILDYTRKCWGDDVYRRYRDLLRDAIRTITDDPQHIRAKPRDDLFRGIRTYPIGRHYLVFTVSDETVFLVRILHQRMDLRRHLTGLNP